jgi:hypothetical protein
MAAPGAFDTESSARHASKYEPAQVFKQWSPTDMDRPAPFPTWPLITTELFV